MRNSLRMIQYTLYALLIFALSGCGATNTTTAGIDKAVANGKITANLVLPKATGKTVALPAIATVRLKVTGATIPTATQDFPGSTGGSLDVYPGKQLTVTAQALDAAGAMVAEGFARNVTVDAGKTTNASIQMNVPVVKAADTACLGCHDSTRDTDKQNLVANYKQSGHYQNTANMFPKNGSTQAGCAGCHGTSHNDLNPAASGRCAECHSSINISHNTYTGQAAPITGAAATTCGKCHVTHDFKLAKAGCIGCHAIPQNANASGTYVNDNNGVRAIAQEFTKWSHHVTGVTLNDAHCAACHLEGTVVAGKVVVDATVHMADATTHLRDTTANTDADFAWNPAAPNHSGMDTYCMSCHDANGAVSPMSVLIQKFVNDNGLAAAGKTASATNPFGDTISNRYDKMQRPAVVDAKSQFATGNASHHAVRGAKYTGRTRAAGPRQIADAAAFDNGSSATLYGTRSTIYDSVNATTGVKETANAAFNALYVPLGTDPATVATTGLGDDSTLHCGDCHTVGQWKSGVATNAAGVMNTVAIGAHGSNNEYLLRNSIGTDERHTQDAYVTTAGITTLQNPNAAFLVCFNCHSYTRYGSIYGATGATGPHAGEYDAAGRCNGVGNTIPFNGYTTGTATDGTQFVSRFDGPNSKYAATPAFAPGFPLNEANRPATGEQNPDFGNIFGIQCANCHNSGVDGGYGGIHGSTVSTYTDGAGNTNTKRRFLPGLGNVMHVPGTLGGFTGSTDVPAAFKNGSTASGGMTIAYTTGGVSNDTNWEQVGWKQTAAGPVAGATGLGAGCYTLSESATAASAGIKGQSADGGATIPDAFGTWGGCDDHGAKLGQGDHGFVKRINRPVTY